MRLSRPLFLLLAPALAAALGSGAGAAAGQDVELLSRIYGTPLPDGYRRTRAENPRAFEFATGRAVRLPERLRELEAIRTQDRRSGPMAALGARDGAVVGTFRIPVLLGLFADSPADVTPFPRDAVQLKYFGEGSGTITHYYDEVSGGRVTLLGELNDWQRSGVTRASATGGQSGLVPRTTGSFIMDLLRQLPTTVDWGVYDNDGPDGIPNSGDDDGFVDALAVLHSTPGGECGGTESKNRIWSHRWALRYAAGEIFVTATPRPNGGFIRVDDYVVQPVYACNGTALNDIGVFTHELGHAFGLPDLYDTRDTGRHQGVGNWDLMATGSWGCNGNSADSPCHMGAWSKYVLGWADVETLRPDTDMGALTLPAVETTGKIFRVDAGDDSREYYLLENRQHQGFDARIYNDGLLVWRVSQPLLEARWSGNGVNAGTSLGVWIREADGQNELARSGCNRGNAGDPFPFTGPLTACGGVLVEGENRVFHAGSNPSSISDKGTASGLTLQDIRKDGGVVTFRVSTRFTRVTLEAEGDLGVGGLFTLNGAAMAGSTASFRSAPFRVFTVEAARGEPLGPGVRRPFLRWADDAAAPRVRTVSTPLQDLSLVARYGGEQVELAITLTGGQGSVAPGTIHASPLGPDLWFARGTTVTVEARPRRGFSFVRWTGALAGQPNPATLTVEGPVQAAAEFEMIYKVAPATVRISAAADQLFDLVPENGTAPFAWTILQGRLPEGINVNSFGQITGAAMETGAFPLNVEVTDATGLRAQGSFTLQVDEAVIPASALASKFLLAGPPLTLSQLAYLDKRGNGDGLYDLGDFRAWVLAHPGLPLTAPMRALVGPTTVVIPMRPVSGQEGRR